MNATVQRRKKEKFTLADAHRWTHDGDEVLILKCVAADGSAYDGFKWPLEVGAKVNAPDWNADAVCGGGLHGWAWGLGIGEGKEPDWHGSWIVFGCDPGAVVALDGKCKAQAGVVRFVGDWWQATQFVLAGQMALVVASADGKSSATGYSSASSATGDRSASSATGDRSASSATGYSSASSATGDRSASSATGYRSASSATGDSSASSATGYSSASSATGDRSAAVVTGYEGKARTGKFGCIALLWWNKPEGRGEMRCGETGCGDGSDGKLRAEVWYSLDAAGVFVEARS